MTMQDLAMPYTLMPVLSQQCVYVWHICKALLAAHIPGVHISQ